MVMSSVGLLPQIKNLPGLWPLSMALPLGNSNMQDTTMKK